MTILKTLAYMEVWIEKKCILSKINITACCKFAKLRQSSETISFGLKRPCWRCLVIMYSGKPGVSPQKPHNSCQAW